MERPLFRSLPLLLISILTFTLCGDDGTSSGDSGGDIQLAGSVSENFAGAGATVTLKNADGEELASTTADADGSYSLDVPDTSGPVILTATGGSLSGELISIIPSGGLSVKSDVLFALSGVSRSGSSIVRNLNPVTDAINRSIHGDDATANLDLSESEQSEQAAAIITAYFGPLDYEDFNSNESYSAPQAGSGAEPGVLVILVRALSTATAADGGLLAFINATAPATTILEDVTGQSFLAAQFEAAGLAATDVTTILETALNSGSSDSIASNTAAVATGFETIDTTALDGLGNEEIILFYSGLGAATAKNAGDAVDTNSLINLATNTGAFTVDAILASLDDNELDDTEVLFFIVNLSDKTGELIAGEDLTGSVIDTGSGAAADLKNDLEAAAGNITSAVNEGGVEAIDDLDSASADADLVVFIDGSEVSDGGNYDYGNIGIGTLVTLEIIVENKGLADLNVTSAVTSDDLSFPVSEIPAEVAGLSSHSIKVTFQAQTDTGYGDTFTLTTDDGDTPSFDINLSATGVANSDNFIQATAVLGNGTNFTTAGTFTTPVAIEATDSQVFIGSSNGEEVIHIYNSHPVSAFNGAPADAVAYANPTPRNIEGLGIMNGILYLAFAGDPGEFRLSAMSGLPTSSSDSEDWSGFTNGCSTTLVEDLRDIEEHMGVFFAVDHSNHRVLGWNDPPTSSSDPVDIVLGDAGCTSGSDNDSFNTPYKLASDGSNLYVSDLNNHRVLVFQGLPETGDAADFVIGQSTLTNVTANDDNQDSTPDANPTSRTLNLPVGIEVIDGELFIADNGNHRILVWETLPEHNFERASRVIGQDDMLSSANNDDDQNGTADTMSDRVMNGPHDLAAGDGKLFAIDQGNNRVLVFEP